MSKYLRITTITFCAFLPTYLIRFSIFSIPTTLLEILFLVLFVWWMIESRKKLFNKILTYISQPIVWPTLVIVLTATIGIFISPDIRSALGIWKSYFIEPMLFSIILFDVLSIPKTKEWIFRSIGFSGFVVSFYGILQWIFQLPIPPPWNLERRITSFFQYPNALSLFVGPIVILSLVQWWQTRNEKSLWRWFWFLTFIIGNIAIVLAKSDAAIASIAITILFFFLVQKQTRKITYLITTILIVVAISFQPVRSSLIEKFTFQDWSEKVRLSQWTETIHLLKDNFVFGVGLSGYPIALHPYHKATYLEIFQYPHNIFLNVWVELGFLGLLSFLVLGSMMKLKILTTKPFFISTTSFIFFQMFFHGLVDVPYFKNDLAMLTWILFAIFLYEYGQFNKSKK